MQNKVNVPIKNKTIKNVFGQCKTGYREKSRKILNERLKSLFRDL
ncbi:hypothetical protein LEP1GSC029_2850 [Leptospira interrogans str. 2002000626]|uniref:Uncharacterized protein n=1 Tax=Leptospira interrogans str. 2002000626 TaxID=996803 RepID=A0A829CT68_LEPIR|nr:hypothetical protein LEP1GSC029_2850 [Leptospira interrogans str. 2002000626]